MILRPTIVAAVVAAGVIGAGHAPAHAQGTIAARPGDAVALFHRFTIPPRIEWGPISINLVPGGWRVGSLDGPVASEAQLRAVLSRMTALEVGGRCAGWVERDTYYTCGFAIRGLDLAGMVEQRFTMLTTDWGDGVGQGQRDAVAERPMPSQDLSAYGLISPVPDVQRFVSLQAPASYLGDKSRALGASIRFDFRAVTNMLVPSDFDRASGAVVLRSEGSERRHAAGGVQS